MSKTIKELYGKLRDGEISMQTFSEEYNKLAEVVELVYTLS